MSNKKALIYAAIFREMQSVCTKLTDAVQFINLYFIVVPDAMPADVPFTRNFYLKLSFTSSNFAFEKVEHMHTYFVNRTEHKISNAKIEALCLEVSALQYGEIPKIYICACKTSKRNLLERVNSCFFYTVSSCWRT